MLFLAASVAVKRKGFSLLAEGLPPYPQSIGIAVRPDQIPQLGASGIADYRQFYDDETRRFVEDLCRYEIDRFGHKLEELE